MSVQNRTPSGSSDLADAAGRTWIGTEGTAKWSPVSAFGFAVAVALFAAASCDASTDGESLGVTSTGDDEEDAVVSGGIDSRGSRSSGSTLPEAIGAGDGLPFEATSPRLLAPPRMNPAKNTPHNRTPKANALNSSADLAKIESGAPGSIISSAGKGGGATADPVAAFGGGVTTAAPQWKQYASSPAAWPDAATALPHRGQTTCRAIAVKTSFPQRTSDPLLYHSESPRPADIPLVGCSAPPSGRCGDAKFSCRGAAIVIP
jgi:hypothetical protein